MEDSRPHPHPHQHPHPHPPRTATTHMASAVSQRASREHECIGNELLHLRTVCPKCQFTSRHKLRSPAREAHRPDDQRAEEPETEPTNRPPPDTGSGGAQGGPEARAPTPTPTRATRGRTNAAAPGPREAHPKQLRKGPGRTTGIPERRSHRPGDPDDEPEDDPPDKKTHRAGKPRKGGSHRRRASEGRTKKEKH